jgi:hypothetical protein
MNRRHFMQAILAACTAPAVFSSGIASGILMPVRLVQVVEEEVPKWMIDQVVTEFGEWCIRLPVADIGMQYVIKNERKGTLRIYPGPVVMNSGEVFTFAQ